MEFKLKALACTSGECVPLAPRESERFGHAHRADSLAFSWLQEKKVGARLCDTEPLFILTGFCQLPGGGGSLRCPLLECCRQIPQDTEFTLTLQASGWSVAVITLSDKGAKGLRTDEAGPAAVELVRAGMNVGYFQRFLLPDERDRLRALLVYLALDAGFDLILTTGGTGLSPRDVTPEATARVIDVPVPGLAQAMLTAGLQKTPYAALSRAVAGVLGKSLIINLPGSVKAVRENLGSVLPALEHALKKINGDPADCGG